MRAFAEVLPSERYAFYGWKHITDAAEFQGAEFRALGMARLVFGNSEVTVDARPSLPTYDWDGLPIPLATVAYGQNRNPRVSEAVADEHIRATTKIVSAALDVVAPDWTPHVRTCTSHLEGMHDYAYIIDVPSHYVQPALLNICESFHLKEGVGTFEFLGAAHEVQTLAATRGYLRTEFPENCWSLNSSLGRTPFAIERASFRYPVLNVTSDKLHAVAEMVDRLGSDITYCSVIRKYMAWNLGAGISSPRVQDNYALLSRQRTGYAMFVGFERYSDEDPPTRRYVSALRPILLKMGAKLKRVSYIR